MAYEIVRVTSKGQMTIPVSVRKILGIREGDSLAVRVDGNEIRLRKIEVIHPLSDADPIWKLIGAGESGERDVSEKHDRYVAEGETKRWQR
ncbi:MAG TPA: AbrB/MazE/SpoVT family DNA-binding domain-containing protein [Firmicutes bacterium]|nr:AbrB/MazE/SpoVT family DNA-binding domain-containing protein [Candidatus Fermentithermobacillaceae bacterium]